MANWKRSDWKSQSTSEIATKIASKSVGKWVDIATGIAMIRIAAISNRYRVGLQNTSDLGSESLKWVRPCESQKGRCSQEEKESCLEEREGSLEERKGS